MSPKGAFSFMIIFYIQRAFQPVQKCLNQGMKEKVEVHRRKERGYRAELIVATTNHGHDDLRWA